VANSLSPNAKQQFFDNNGKPLVGGKLFTYAAGTSTKLATKVSSAGADNANPIILDYRGECNLWIPPNVAYKYILAPSTDTDPPTHAIWTVDAVVSSQLISLYGGTDTGSVNTYALTFTAPFTAYADGIVIYWLPANSNTGAATLNVNGLGPLAIVDQSGNPLTAGAIVVNQITGVILSGGSWRIMTVSAGSAGTFTGTLTGMAGATIGTVSYRVSPTGVVSLLVAADIFGASNTTALTMTGLPAAVRPGTATVTVPCWVRDNTNTGMAALAIVDNTGFIEFRIAKTNAVANFDQYLAAGFTAAGSKGLPAGWSITYQKWS
jgi:hypothetical protein